MTRSTGSAETDSADGDWKDESVLIVTMSHSLTSDGKESKRERLVCFLPNPL